jgi:integrase
MQKSTLRLTESAVETLRADGRDRIVFDALQPGFGVRITPAGTKIFIVQARVGGRPHRIAIGRHPDKKVADARAEARGALQDMRAGRDPKIEKADRARSVEAGQTTVAAFAERWLDEYVRPKLKPRTAADYEKLVEQKIKPALGHLILARVAKDDILKFHATMKATPRRANYTVRTVGALMTYAEDCRLRPQQTNPCRRIKMYPERLRERFMDEAEIGRAAEAITEAEREGVIGPHAAAGLRLALLTGARSGEVTAIRWVHVDFERRQIRLPDSNEPGRKTGARTIYLPAAAVELLKTVPRVGPFVVAGAKPGEPYQNLGRAWIVVRGRAGLDDVRLHDIRHSFASMAAAKGHSLPMIGKLLGHKVAATTQRYAHLARDIVSDVADEIGAAMTAAFEKKSPPPGNVVKLRRPAARTSWRTVPND